MRIYEGEHSVHRILEDCQLDVRGNGTPPPGVVEGIDLIRLNERLDTINIPEIRRRRKQMEVFYQEIIVSSTVDRGVNFTSCLMILAHYKVISDSKSLRLEEYLRRRARLQRVEEEVHRRVVKGFFDTLYWARKFRSRLESRKSARMMTVPQFAVPEIFIDDQDVTETPYGSHSPPASPTNISPTDRTGGRSHHDSGLRRRESRSGSPSAGPSGGGGSPSLSVARPSLSDASTSFSWGGYDGTGAPLPGQRSRAGSSADRQNVLEVFEESAWGESMRRSFTLRRSGTRRGGTRANSTSGDAGGGGGSAAGGGGGSGGGSSGGAV